MKKFMLLFLFFSLAVSAQVFPEYDLSYLKPGMKVTVRDDYEYTNFRENERLNRYYKQEGNYTNPDSIKGRTFEIIDISPYKPPYYSSKTSFRITLKDINNEEIIYYQHNIGEYTELNMAEDLQLPDEYFCNHVKPILGSDSFYIDNEIKIIKSKTNGKTHYFVTLETLAIKKNSGKGTITITLKNGKTIVRKNVTTKPIPTGGGILESYEADITFTLAEMNLLKESEIVSYDFFSLYERRIDKQIAGVTKGAVACLIKK